MAMIIGMAVIIVGGYWIGDHITLCWWVANPMGPYWLPLGSIQREWQQLVFYGHSAWALLNECIEKTRNAKEFMLGTAHPLLVDSLTLVIHHHGHYAFVVGDWPTLVIHHHGHCAYC